MQAAAVTRLEKCMGQRVEAHVKTAAEERHQLAVYSHLADRKLSHTLWVVAAKPLEAYAVVATELKAAWVCHRPLQIVQ